MAKSRTTDEFIEESKAIHGDRYDYSKVVYVNSTTKVIIICPTHGEFEQSPPHHLNGSKCYMCSGKNKTTEMFINESKAIHGDKYDYSKVKYIKSSIYVTIICPDHGEFEQIPDNHLRGNNCHKCNGNKLLTTKDFIEKSKRVHGNKYNYSIAKYRKSKSKVNIICPEHGQFKQTASNHMFGHGCPNCRESKGEKTIKNFLLKNKISFNKEKTFDGCRDKGLLPFDFYLDEFNICIEFDGMQHFVAVDVWGGENGLLEQKRRDLIKTQYCVDSNIKLLRISYKENIIDKIKNFLQNENILQIIHS